MKKSGVIPHIVEEKPDEVIAKPEPAIMVESIKELDLELVEEVMDDPINIEEIDFSSEPIPTKTDRNKWQNEPRDLTPGEIEFDKRL